MAFEIEEIRCLPAFHCRQVVHAGDDRHRKRQKLASATHIDRTSQRLTFDIAHHHSIDPPCHSVYSLPRGLGSGINGRRRDFFEPVEIDIVHGEAALSIVFFSNMIGIGDIKPTDCSLLSDVKWTLAIHPDANAVRIEEPDCSLEGCFRRWVNVYGDGLVRPLLDEISIFASLSKSNR